MPALPVIEMNPTQVAKLYCGEGHFYVSCCDNEAGACICAQPVYFGDRVAAGDLVAAKRKEASYPKTMSSLVRSGQRQPVQVCRNGCCLSNGHHRLAALLELGASIILIKRSGYCYKPARFGFVQSA